MFATHTYHLAIAVPLLDQRQETPDESLADVDFVADAYPLEHMCSCAELQWRRMDSGHFGFLLLVPVVAHRLGDGWRGCQHFPVVGQDYATLLPQI